MSDRTALVERMCALLAEKYVFPEVAAEVAAVLRDRCATGHYAELGDEELTVAVTRDLQSVNGDRHLRLLLSVEEVSEGEEESEADLLREVAADAGGIRRVERLPGNVGYLDLIGFLPADLAGGAAAAAMTLLAGTEALIVDLRRSRGGDPAMVALLTSYLVDEPTHLNDLWRRADGSTIQFWTVPYVPGPRFGGTKPLWVLTASATFSAAEEFAYNLQQLGRATVVGERTRGGAHPCDRVRMGPHLVLTLPVMRALNPVSGTNWEGVGVAPDVEVPAAEALPVAVVRALDHVLGLPPGGRRTVLEEARRARAELPPGR
jgi:C-terminal processing protease CtpA/Prc